MTSSLLNTGMGLLGRVCLFIIVCILDLSFSAIKFVDETEVLDHCPMSKMELLFRFNGKETRVYTRVRTYTSFSVCAYHSVPFTRSQKNFPLYFSLPSALSLSLSPKSLLSALSICSLL